MRWATPDVSSGQRALPEPHGVACAEGRGLRAVQRASHGAAAYSSLGADGSSAAFIAADSPANSLRVIVLVSFWVGAFFLPMVAC